MKIIYSDAGPEYTFEKGDLEPNTTYYVYVFTSTEEADGPLSSVEEFTIPTGKTNS